MKVYKTIEESTNSRKKDPNSPTGWVRRTGAERVQAGKRVTMNHIWEPCDPPKVYLYGEQPERMGGTIRTVFEDVTPVDVTATPEEIEVLVNHYMWQIEKASHVLGGGTEPSDGVTLANAVPKMLRARAKALRFGVDLFDVLHIHLGEGMEDLLKVSFE